MTTIGVLGTSWRATVEADGTIVTRDADRTPLHWHVAADDRWHTPRTSPSIRQRRVEGVPVVETRMRIPRGDVVQRVYAVADHGGMTVVHVENDSPLPIAVAFDGPAVCSARPATAVPIQGIDLPPGTAVFPVGHHATLTVALPHTRTAPFPLPRLAAAEQVVRGWTAACEKAGRLALPAVASTDAVTSARCELLLTGAGDFAEDPVAFLIGAGELVRLGADAAPLVPEVAAAVRALAGVGHGWDVVAAIDAAAIVMRRADELRAGRDLARLRCRHPATRIPAGAPAGVRVVPWVERSLVHDDRLLPLGIPQAWFGQQFEVHDVPAGPARSVSFALRWHGERPAVLWEVTGEPLTLRSPVAAPGWSSDAAQGEALWPRHHDRAQT